MAPSVPPSIPPILPLSHITSLEANGQDVNRNPLPETIKLGFLDDRDSRLGFADEGLRPCEAAVADCIGDKSCVKESSQLEGLCNGKTKGSSDGIAPKQKAPKIVHWSDDYGQDIAQVREFEPSDSGDSDEDADSAQACNCVIL